MRVNITARHFKLNEDLKDFTENEVERFQKYYDNILDVEVILAWEKKDRLAEINIKVDGKLLSAHDRSEEMKKSIVLVIEKLERQLDKHKSRKRGFTHESINDVQLTEPEK